jgi:hypothetical protein
MWSVTRTACVGSIWQILSDCAMRSCAAEAIKHGRPNSEELEVEGASGHLELLALRLYDPQARQWSSNTSNTWCRPIRGGRERQQLMHKEKI